MKQLKITIVCLFSVALMGGSALAGAQEITRYNEGNYFCSDDELREIENNNQIAAYYCDEKGNCDDRSNPNGALKNIAGILNKEKNVLGMMPHPERMIDKYLSGEDGSIFFKNLLNNLKI